MIAVLLGLAAAAASEEPSYHISNLSAGTLPYLVPYMQCFSEKSDLAQKLLAKESADASRLPELCRTLRQPLYDAAIKKMRDGGSDDILQEKRRLERAFNIIDKNNPLPGQSPATAK